MLALVLSPPPSLLTPFPASTGPGHWIDDVNLAHFGHLSGIVVEVLCTAFMHAQSH